MTLADFLLARIAEDEAAVAQAVRDGDPWCYSDPARVLAECEAKRRLLADPQLAPDPEWDLFPDQSIDVLDRIARHLALPYSSHPDYDEAWRP